MFLSFIHEYFGLVLQAITLMGCMGLDLLWNPITDIIITFFFLKKKLCLYNPNREAFPDKFRC